MCVRGLGVFDFVKGGHGKSCTGLVWDLVGENLAVKRIQILQGPRFVLATNSWDPLIQN